MAVSKSTRRPFPDTRRLAKPVFREPKRSLFRPGTSGACEALLYEFCEFAPFTSGSEGKEPDPHALGAKPVRIAATGFEEAFSHLFKSRPGFRVESAKYVGIVEMLSGSPLD